MGVSVAYLGETGNERHTTILWYHMGWGTRLRTLLWLCGVEKICEVGSIFQRVVLVIELSPDRDKNAFFHANQLYLRCLLAMLGLSS